MKPVMILLLALYTPFVVGAQAWTAGQLAAANNAKNERSITPVEREIVMYLNLARLYPQQFANQEVSNYKDTAHYSDPAIHTTYRKSLMETLNALQPLPAFAFSKEMYALAKCFAQESGKKGLVGHDRLNCKDGYFAECCSYGMKDAKGVVLQWLLDEDVPSLGHRKICLSEAYQVVGISMYTHREYGYCAVADFK